jgi:TIR domain/Caspase domain
MMSNRLGLLIATTGYADSQLPAVPGGSTHISDLADVLRSPKIGGFSLTVLIDPTLETARSAITAILASRQPDDLVLLYVLGHCIRQTGDTLFLALRETTRSDLENTAIPAAFVQQQLTETAAKRQIIILDSLLGSVVSTETPLRRDSPLNVRLSFCVPNRHQAILAASDYLSFCLAGEHYVAVRSAQPPVAESIVRGLRSRAADEKGDRHVSVNGLLNYLKYVGSARQDEMRVGWTSEAAGDLIVAAYPDEAIGQNQEHSPTRTVTPATAPPAGSLLIDDNVKFTAYRPAILVPGKWRRMMVFMHLDEALTLTEIEARARQVLSADSYGSVIIGESNEYRDVVDNRFSIVQEDEITLVPEVPGIRFNPPRRSFSWATGLRMHAENFFIYAPFSLTDQSVRGRISVFFKQLLLAEIALDLRVAKDSAPKEEGWAKGADQRFRKVFPSYSNHDVEVVEAMEQLQTIGSEYLRKVVKMRSDQQWDEGLPATIADADVFQLFWSRNAAQSAQVEKEWRHAITLQRVAFVRPVYWEVPMAEAPEPLRRLRFCFLPGIHPITDRRKDAVWDGAPVEDQRSSVDRPEVPDVAPPGNETQIGRTSDPSSPPLTSMPTPAGSAETQRKKILPGIALLGAVVGGCLLIFLSINPISRTFLTARHPSTYSGTPAATPSAQTTPSAQVETPILTAPTPFPTQSAATPGPFPTQSVATPGPSPTQSVATPGPSPIQPPATPASSSAEQQPSVAPTSTASPEATDSDSPTDRHRRHWHRRLHHRGRGSEPPQT